jgi:hypothetical protein
VDICGIVNMNEIKHFKVFFTIQDDVAGAVRGMLMWHVLVG